MKLPPADLPSVLVASGEALARRFGIEPERWWRILYRQEAPTELELIGLVAAFGPRVKPGDFLPLTSRREDSTIGTMRTAEIEKPRIGRPLKRGDHPFIVALKKARMTLTEEAKAVGRTPTSLRFFLEPKGSPNHRPVPRKLVLYWKQKYGVLPGAWADIAED